MKLTRFWLPRALQRPILRACSRWTSNPAVKPGSEHRGAQNIQNQLFVEGWGFPGGPPDRAGRQ
eukprot:13496834-Alexandrium_andersonii.AAC.1